MTSAPPTLHPEIHQLREELTRHRVYQSVTSVPRLRCFAEHHVFAVWDFMQLLTGLQRHFTCTTIPWTPPACDESLTRLVNELVLGEESDEHPHHGHCSHFVLYQQAMSEMGADVDTTREFVGALHADWSVRSALAIAKVPPCVEEFVRSTMLVVDSDSPLRIAASFTYGRETLIPGMFSALLMGGTQLPEVFRYYLDRHVELDGGEHGDAAEALVAALVRTPDDQAIVDEQAISSLRARVRLWDGVADAIGELE